MSNIQIIHSLIHKSGAETDPYTRDALVELAKELDRIAIIVDPEPFTPAKFSNIIVAAPLPVIIFTYTLNPTNILLEWEAPQQGILFYEVRQGNSWESATRLFVTSGLSAIINPLLIGTTRLLIKTQNVDGVYSSTTTTLDIIIPALGAIELRSETIDSNVLLYWTRPTYTFNIDYYIIKREGIELTRLNATFIHIKELAGGNFDYSITPVDIAGNIGTEVTINVDVDNPPDFVLRDSFVPDFTTGTRINAIIDSNQKLLVNVNITETWQEHFDTRSWDSPQDQVDAGYPLFIQPTPATGSYKETFDIGIIITGALITHAWSYELLSGTFNIGASTRVSDDGVAWSSPQLGQNVYFPSARYIEVTISFTGANDTALMYFYDFTTSVSVKEEMDSGEISAISSDANGTVVTFNKSFKDVNSITVAVKTTTEQFISVFRFTDIPNPTQFTVFVYDTSGIRVSKTVQWKARGIV